jgi:trans-aconitate 2-methyltransferase
MTADQHYTFGDNDAAAERLVLLARAFERSTRVWLGGLALPRAGRVVDLGCGPGLTSALLASVTDAAQLYGLDQSERLLARARATAAPRMRFLAHDLTQGPLPVPLADVLYARFLLTHLANPSGVLQLWAQAVRPGGLLLLEEVAGLESEDPTFARYYALVEALQAHYGQLTYIGRQLGELARGPRWRLLDSRTQPIALPAATMARLHALNLQTWGQDAHARAAFDQDELRALGLALARVADGAYAPEVRCHVAQVVLRRAPESEPRARDIRIEPAAAGDAAALLALQRNAFASEAERENCWSIAPLTQSEAELRDDLDRGPALVARQAGAIVGSVRARMDGSTCHVARLMVRQDLQGRGLGQALMAALHERCKAAERFELFTGARSARALDFYDRLGYVRTGTGRECGGVDVVYMARSTPA